MILLAVLTVLVGCDLPFWEDTDDDLGLDSLRRRVGTEAMPTGKGVRLALVEADNTAEAGNSEADDSEADNSPIKLAEEQNIDSPRSYVPDATRAGLQDKTITDQSGQTHPPGAVSGHATGMARIVCGKGGIAPGVQEIDAYLSTRWFLQGPLKSFRPELPEKIPARVANHSWIANKLPDDDKTGLKGEQIAAEYLRRADLLIDRDGLVMVVGVNNGRDTKLPSLMGHAYNVIAVGVSSGDSSFGPTHLASEVAGRCKPDIVCPARTTSAATAKVSGAAALLLETADSHADAALAARPEVIKAVLLAGATRDEEEFVEPWPDDTAQPLDFRRGAGELNINNSHLILSAERGEPSVEEPASSTGWGYDEIEKGGASRYHFHISPGEENKTLSIALVWHRKVVAVTLGPKRPAIIVPLSLAQLDLRLIRVESDDTELLIAESISSIDNVEYLLIEQPAAGEYYIEVICLRGSVPFALAWQARGADEPTFSVAVRYALMYSTLLLAAIVFYVWRRRRGRKAVTLPNET